MRFEDGEDRAYYGWRYSYWVLGVIWIAAVGLSGGYGLIAGRHHHFCVIAAMFSFGLIGLLAAVMGGRGAAAFLVDCFGAAFSLFASSRGIRTEDKDEHRPVVDTGPHNTGWGPFFRVIVAAVLGGVWALIVHFIAVRW